MADVPLALAAALFVLSPHESPHEAPAGVAARVTTDRASPGAAGVLDRATTVLMREHARRLAEHGGR